jgi:glycosyltransferase involved in cell wall biosynthesis
MRETTGSYKPSTQPLITIGIPTRNRSSLLRNCVASALAQTYSNIEVLISDNASTDDTLEMLKGIGDPRLRVMSNAENIGLVANWNKCVYEARGEYVTLVSDDNILDPTFLEKCVNLVKQEPGIPIVISAYDVLVLDEFHPNDKRLVPPILSQKLSTGIWDGTEVLKEYLRGKFSAQTLSSIMRTDILQRNGGFPAEHLCADDDAAFGLMLLEGRAGLVNERCATYMVHASSYSDALGPDYRFRDLCKVMEEISDAAARKVRNETARREVQRLTLRYVAFKAIQSLVSYRKDGAKLTDVVRQVWNWRGLLGRCSLLDFATTMRLRSLGRILLPTPVIKLSVALKIDRLL